jgi:hypothetical protein
VTGNNECYSQGADDVPNASTNLSSQISRARWTTVPGALFFESGFLRYGQNLTVAGLRQKKPHPYLDEAFVNDSVLLRFPLWGDRIYQSNPCSRFGCRTEDRTDLATC